MGKEKAVALKNETPLSAEGLISQAIAKNVSVETMEKLLAMRRELKAERAKEEYDQSMSEFQADCPTIQKTKAVLNKDGRSVRYKFAPIESIVEQVKPYLQKHGFSYAINTKIDQGQMTVICRITHEAGHSESSEFSVPIDKEAYMNEAQKVASASTFAKRYAFCNAFGILTGDEDDDSVLSGQSAKPPIKVVPRANSGQRGASVAMISNVQAAKIGTLMKELAMDEANIEKQLGKKISQLTAKQAASAIDNLERIKKEREKNMTKTEIDIVCGTCGEIVSPSEYDDAEGMCGKCAAEKSSAGL